MKKTQGLYGKREIDTRGTLIAQIMRYWRTSAEQYRVVPIKYAFLLREKKALHFSVPIRQLSAAQLSLYPEIPFLRIVDEVEARESLDWLSDCGLKSLLGQLEGLRTNFAYNTMQSWCSEAQLQLAKKLTSVAMFCSTDEHRVPGIGGALPFLVNFEGYVAPRAWPV